MSELLGQRFSRLIVEERTNQRRRGEVLWQCLCDCGNKTLIPAYSLKSGNTSSCGCLRKEKLKEASETYGMSNSPTYAIWCNMKARCYNSNNANYSDYGGRGIEVSDRWRDSFANFLTDMGEKPENMTLERIDVEDDYSSANCKWATRSEQARNRRVYTPSISVETKLNIKEQYYVEEKTMESIAREFNLSKKTVGDIIHLPVNYQTVNNLKWKKFPSGSAGFVYLVDVMGTDYDIVNAARVSYGSGTKKVNTAEGLIRYLMRNGHTSPFEMCELKFYVRVPMDIWRQWIRHRTASVNEYSTRYSEAIDGCATTLPGEWRQQSKKNNQGSDGFLSSDKIGAGLTARETSFHQEARILYEERLKVGVAREQARKDLPLSNYTEAYWKIDLHNLLHFLRLRMDDHAQSEIRDFANIIGFKIVAELFPMTWKAFEDYQLSSVRLSGLELVVLHLLSQDVPLLEASTEVFSNKRERNECILKLEKLGYGSDV